jgi:hypothetical protein
VVYKIRPGRATSGGKCQENARRNPFILSHPAPPAIHKRGLLGSNTGVRTGQAVFSFHRRLLQDLEDPNSAGMYPSLSKECFRKLILII